MIKRAELSLSESDIKKYIKRIIKADISQIEKAELIEQYCQKSSLRVRAFYQTTIEIGQAEISRVIFGNPATKELPKQNLLDELEKIKEIYFLEEFRDKDFNNRISAFRSNFEDETETLRSHLRVWDAQLNLKLFLNMIKEYEDELSGIKGNRWIFRTDWQKTLRYLNSINSNEPHKSDTTFLKWTGTNTELVELFKALREQNVLSPTLSDSQSFELLTAALNVSIKKDTVLQNIKARKKDSSVFLTKLITSLENWIRKEYI